MRLITDVERITGYFQTADESAASVMFQVIKGIMAARFTGAVKKTRGPNKPKSTPSPARQAAAAGIIASGF